MAHYIGRQQRCQSTLNAFFGHERFRPDMPEIEILYSVDILSIKRV